MVCPDEQPVQLIGETPRPPRPSQPCRYDIGVRAGGNGGQLTEPLGGRRKGSVPTI